MNESPGSNQFVFTAGPQLSTLIVYDSSGIRKVISAKRL
jgi:hypothetical protein